MLSLLNRERRHFLRREYSQRVFAVILATLILAAFYYGALLFSNIFLVNFENQMLEKEKELISNSEIQKTFEEFEEKNKHLQKEYDLFSIPRISVENLSTKILSKNLKGINLNYISYFREKDLIKIDLRGNALNRDVLVEYANSFKNDLDFVDVNIPISNFTKNTDIPFNLSMNFKIKQNEN